VKVPLEVVKFVMNYEKPGKMPKHEKLGAGCVCHLGSRAVRP